MFMNRMSTETTVETTTRVVRRRLSSPASSWQNRSPNNCSPQSLSLSLSALDLSSSSSIRVLASIRSLILSHLLDIEVRLSHEDFTFPESVLSTSGTTVEDARIWAKEILDLLKHIKDDVCSHLPDMRFDASSIEATLRSHMNEFSSLDVVRARLPEFDLLEVRTRFQDVRAHLPEMPVDINHPLKYLTTLYDRLHDLHGRLSKLQQSSENQPPSLPSTRTILDIIDRMLSSDFSLDTLQNSVEAEARTLEKAAKDVAKAMKRSLDGSRLIRYVDLPFEWQSNPFVHSGYRFIPLSKWPLLLLSLFALHNETLNIHTHMIPLLHSFMGYFSFINYSAQASDLPETAFMVAAQMCLLSSVTWHTMAGCAHQRGMELSARIDYIGISWLISTSIGTIVYYGLCSYPKTSTMYLVLCGLAAIAGTICPFMQWFNDIQYKHWRIAFYITMALTGLAPLVHLSYLYSLPWVISFISPLCPSFICYIIGVIFYATHFPECYFSNYEALSKWIDYMGGGSHAIWHGFVVLAIYQHKWGLRHLRASVYGDACL